MPQIHNLPLNLPVRYCSAIGEVVARWARLEIGLQILLWRAMGLDNRQGRVLTVGMPARALFGALRSLKHNWVGDAGTETTIRALVKDAEAAKNERDAIVHGVWGHTKGKPRPLRILRMKFGDQRVMPRSYPLTPADMTTPAANLKELNKRADGLIRLVVAARKRATRR